MEGDWKPGLCANCLQPLDPAAVTMKHSAFCDDFCSKRAQGIRYAYKAIRDGRSRDPMTARVLYGEFITFFALDLAYLRARVPDGLRAEVLDANGGLCTACNTAPATEVDHISGGSNDRDNLQGLCRSCHESKPRGAIPEDITRAGLDTIDETASNDDLREVWQAALMTLEPYDPQAPTLEWGAVRQLADELSDTRFGKLSSYLLGNELATPAHQEDWSTTWRAHAKASRGWAKQQMLMRTDFL